MMKMIFLMLMMSYLLLYISNYMIWWGIFMIFTMVGISKMKFYLSPSYSMITYYYIQEIGGILFMMGLSYSFQFILIMMKGGFSPFHNWMNNIFLSIKGLVFLWMLTWQKFPYYLVLSQLMIFKSLLLVLMSSLLPLMQVIFSMSYKISVFLMMISSGNNMLIYLYLSSFHCYFFLMFYLFMNYSVMGMLSQSGNLYLGLETMFILMSMPGSIPFFVKMFFMSILSNSGGFLMILFLLGMLMNFVITVNLMFNQSYKFSIGNKSFLFMMISFSLLLYI